MKGVTDQMSKNKKGKKKKWKKVVLITAIIIIAIVWIVVRSALRAKDNIAIVDTQKVKTEDITSTLNTSGTISSMNEKVYASAVTATVGEVNVKVGDTVNAGDYLVTYDTASLEASYTQAELESKASEANRNDTLNRSSEGETKKANAEAQIADYNSQIAAKQADVNTLKQALLDYSIQTNSNSTELAGLQKTLEELSVAHAAGQLTEEQQNTWNSAQNRISDINAQNAAINENTVKIQADLEGKQTAIAELQSKLATAEGEKSAATAAILSDNAKANLSYSSQASQITLTKAEDQLNIAKAGIISEFNGIVTEVQAMKGMTAAEGQQLVKVSDSSAMKIDIQVSKYNLEQIRTGQEAKITFLSKQYKGKVGEISKLARTGNSGAAMVTAEVIIEDPDDDLILGLDAKVEIILDKEKNASVVPLVAVNTDVDGDFVYAIENYIVVKHPVKVGISSNDKVQILEGVESGDSIITTVDASIVEGMPALTKEDLK